MRMLNINRIFDLITYGSGRPIRRLATYYAILALVVAAFVFLFPGVARLVLGRGVDVVSTAPMLLQDGLINSQAPTAPMGPGSLPILAATITIALIGTLALMLPVSWIYMAARRVPGHNQSVAQALVILPIVIAGVVFIVRDSLALALSLAGVVAAVRFRTNLRDARDSVFIFLAIAVGFSAGVQALAVGALLSIVFNLVLLLTWRYDFGRNVLAPTATDQWTEPLSTLARSNGNERIPDRDLVLALTPKKVDALAQRFDRVRDVLGTKKKKPRFNAVLSLSSHKVAEAQALTEKVLEKSTKRWRLDEVATEAGKPTRLYYLVRLRKTTTRDDLITAVRMHAGESVDSVDLEMGEAAQREN